MRSSVVLGALALAVIANSCTSSNPVAPARQADQPAAAAKFAVSENTAGGARSRRASAGTVVPGTNPGGVAISASPVTSTAERGVKPVTVTVVAGQNKVEGDADPVFTYTSSDPAATFSGALSRVPGETAGIYAIGQGTLSATNGYAISSFVPADFTIKAKVAFLGPQNGGGTSGTISGTNLIYNGVTYPITGGRVFFPDCFNWLVGPGGILIVPQATAGCQS